MEIKTWNKEGYIVNYIIEEGCTLILSSGKSTDKKIAKEVAGWEKLL